MEWIADPSISVRTDGAFRVSRFGTIRPQNKKSLSSEMFLLPVQTESRTIWIVKLRFGSGGIESGGKHRQR